MAQTSLSTKPIKKSTKSTARDVFFYMLMIVALYISVTSFITLLFQYINKLLPETLPFMFESVGSGVMIGASSALIIAWPVFIVMVWLIARDLKKNPEKQNLGVKRWLTYLTLFIASIVILITLITLVNNLLSGELSLRVGLKILTTLMVAGAVLGYYVWDLRRTLIKKSLVPRIVAWVTSALIIAGIVIGFFIIGSPAEQRAKKFDEARVFNVQQLQFNIMAYYGQKGELPQTLDQLVDGIIVTSIPTDPDTGLDYEYSVTGPLTFELCATFETDNTDVAKGEVRPIPAEIGIFGPMPENLTHTIGRVCFDRTIDPDIASPDSVPFITR